MKMKTIPWKSAFLRVALGQAVSQLGSHGVQFALIWWLAEETASPGVLGAAGLVAYLPMTLLSPLAGVAADRWNRKVLCITADLAMGGAALGYAVLLGQFALPPWTVLILLGLRGVGSTFQQPAIQSILPQLVPGDQLVRANGWMQLLNGGAFLLGPVIGAALYAAFPLPVVLLSDVVGAALASLALAGVKIPPLVRQGDPTGGFWAEFQAGLAVFRRDRALGRLVAAQALCMFFYAPLSAFYPLMTSDYFQRSAWYGSAVELAFAVGMVVSAFVFSKVGQVGGKLRLSSLGLFAMGGGAALCGLLPPHPGGLGGLCRAVPGAGGGGQRAPHPPAGLPPGDGAGGADGAGLLGAHPDLLGGHAGGPAGEQPPGRAGGGGLLVPAVRPGHAGGDRRHPGPPPPRPGPGGGGPAVSRPRPKPGARRKNAPASHGDAGALCWEEGVAGVTWRIPRP